MSRGAKGILQTSFAKCQPSGTAETSDGRGTISLSGCPARRRTRLHFQRAGCRGSATSESPGVDREMDMNARADQLKGWIPIRLYWNERTPAIDWCWIGTRRFTDSFFSQTIDACLQLPFSSLFRPQTPIDTLRERHA